MGIVFKKRFGFSPKFSQKFRLTAAAAAIVGIVAGCGYMQPYEEVAATPQTQSSGTLRFAGNAGPALLIADDLRHRYFLNLAHNAEFGNSTAVAAGALSGWAMYNALKSNGSGATAATPVDTRRGLMLGVTLATLYGLRQYFLNPPQGAIYAQKYEALTCLMLQSAPLLMTESTEPLNFVAMDGRGFGAYERTLDHITDPRVGDMDRMQRALAALEDEILVQSRLVATYQTQLDLQIGQTDKLLVGAFAPQQKVLDDARKALSYARHALEDGKALVRLINGAGADIQARVGIIASAALIESQAAQNSLPDAATLLKNASGITNDVLSIGVQSAVDDASDGAGSSAATTSLAPSMNPQHFAFNMDHPAVLLAGPMSAAAGRLFAVRAAPAAGGAGASKPASGAAATPSAPASGSSAAPKAPTKNDKKKTTDPTPPKKAKTAPKPIVSSPPTSKELQAIRDALNTAIAAMAASDQKAQAAATNAKIAALMTALTNQLATNPNGLAPVFSGAGCEIGRHHESMNVCLAQIARDTEFVYALRRPVMQELLNFRKSVRAVGAIPECLKLANLRITPNELVVAHPGDTISYIVSQNGTGNPIASLQGPADPASGAKLTALAVGGTSLTNISVVLGAAISPQLLNVSVANSTADAFRTLPILVLPKLKSVAPAASAASGAASDPAS